MGDPKQYRRKYETPLHPWNKTVIETEKVLVRDFGLKNKHEIHIANSFLRRYKILAKKFIALTTAQAEKEKSQILDKLFRTGIIAQGAGLDQILGLELKDILERRLQSQIYRKGFARTMKQARQFITHRHILIGNKEITSPSYLVSRADESMLAFKTASPLATEDHPERTREAAEKPVVEEKPARKTTAKKIAPAVEQKSAESVLPASETPAVAAEE
ncbi:30S ribosomal protein S4 [Candidatus Woesearchaeota archaeon]|nr:30S ribosomal protein S4 [Candidatus Woesearchaeota archaeon]